MKKLFTILTLAFAINFVNGQATQTYVTNNMSSGIATVSTTGGILLSLTAYTTNIAPTFLRFYDGYYTATNGAYTNYIVYTTNVVTSYITTTGITNNLTNLVIKTVANPVAAVSGAPATPVLTLVVPGAPASGFAPLVWNDGLIFGRRLTLSNSLTGLTILGTYRSQ